MTRVFKAILAAMMLGAACPAMAALRGISGIGDSATCATPCTISDTYAGANAIQSGDLILIVTNLGTGGSEGTITDPTSPGTAFTAGSALSPALADINIDSGSSYLHIAAKIATSADAGFPTYVTTTQYGGHYSQQIIVLSGRAATLAAALDNQVATASSAELTTPAAYSLTGLTALSGDDIISIIGIACPFGRGTATFSAAISGYSNVLNTIGTQTYSPGISTLTSLNSAAGVFGPLASTISATASETIAMGGFVLSIPAAAAGFTPHPVMSGGHPLISNGHPVIG